MTWANLKPEQRELATTLLTDKQLAVFRYWIDGHSIRRIALALDLDESTVRGRLTRALRRMRPHLRKEAA